MTRALSTRTRYESLYRGYIAQGFREYWNNRPSIIDEHQGLNRTQAEAEAIAEAMRDPDHFDVCIPWRSAITEAQIRTDRDVPELDSSGIILFDEEEQYYRERGRVFHRHLRDVLAERDMDHPGWRF